MNISVTKIKLMSVSVLVTAEHAQCPGPRWKWCTIMSLSGASSSQTAYAAQWLPGMTRLICAVGESDGFTL